MTTPQYPKFCECGKYFTSKKQFDGHKKSEFHKKFMKMKKFATCNTKLMIEDDIQADIHETNVTTFINEISGDVCKSTNINGNIFFGN